MKRLLLLLTLLATLPWSLAIAQEPRTGIEKTVNALLDILYGPQPASVAAREKAVRRAIEKQYSFDVVVQRALGANRQRVSPGELKQIIGLTTDLMIRTYSKRFAAVTRPEVTYGTVREIGRGRVELSSIARIDGAKYEVVYRMAKTSSGWQIYDLVIEGVSLVANYRKQFDQHFGKRGTAAELIARLKSQIDSAR